MEAQGKTAAANGAPPSEAASTRLVQHEFVQANGLRFHVARTGPAGESAGTSPLVLFLHGFPECWYAWRHQLCALGHRFVCVAPDLRGYGETDKPKGGYDLDTLADDVGALVRALGYDRAAIVGHDWGGAIAWHVAARHPEVVTHLAVLNCPPVDVFERAVLTDPDQRRRSGYMFLFQVPWLPERRLLAHGAAMIDRVFRAGAARRDAFTEEDLQVFREAFLRPGAARAALQYYRTNARQRLRFRNLLRLVRPRPYGSRALLTCPGLILWGRDDPALSPTLTKGLEKRFSMRVTKKIFPACGHWTQQEVPDLVNQELARFLCGEVTQ